MAEKALTHFGIRSSLLTDPGAGYGVWPVMLTPFTDAGDVDLAVLDRYTDALIGWGSAGLFPVALSGEMYELDEPERLAIAARVVARADGRVPVVAAVSDSGTAEQIAVSASLLAATGVDAVVLVASRLVPQEADEQQLLAIVAHVIAANPDVTFGIYECPLPYHRLLSTETVQELAATGRFAFFKETSHDLARMSERVRVSEGTPMRILNAGIENLAESVGIGVAGLSGWIANVYPDLALRVIELARSGQLDAAIALQDDLVRVEHGMGPTYPASAKHLVQMRTPIGFRTDSRWRPSAIDPAELRALTGALS